ncbi:MAG: tRNA isopentenyl-2-thiomethyl-A-37 hydroxylase MiaE [Oscillatoria princeps RMCB-10]|nr:tRNA isopentenyl-2-thiomethyl-A-37 hydroxylase MiaE [Oscillatoria princeps RMCB-10]
MESPTLPTIKFLKQPTSGEWVEQAIANPDTLLLERSHCSSRRLLNLMFRYGG